MFDIYSHVFYFLFCFLFSLFPEVVFLLKTRRNKQQKGLGDNLMIFG